MTEEKENYELVIDAIEEGGATDETLVTMLGAKSPKSLPSVFKFCHVLKKFPIKGEDGVYYLVLSKAEYDSAKESGKVPLKPKTLMKDPQGRKVQLEKSLQAKTIAMNKAAEKAKVDCNSTLTIWKHKGAVCSFNIAKLTYMEFRDKMVKELDITSDTFSDCDSLNAYRDAMQDKMDAEYEDKTGLSATDA